MFSIYLAGSMTGRSYEEMSSWRNDIKSELYQESYKRQRDGICIVDPVMYYNTVDNTLYDSDKEYIRWELRNVKNSDIVIARVEKDFSSLGTMSEITTAYNNNIPVLLLIDDIDQTIHPFIEEMCDKKFIIGSGYESISKYIFDYYIQAGKLNFILGRYSGQ